LASLRIPGGTFDLPFLLKHSTYLPSIHPGRPLGDSPGSGLEFQNCVYVLAAGEGWSGPFTIVPTFFHVPGIKFPCAMPFSPIFQASFIYNLL